MKTTIELSDKVKEFIKTGNADLFTAIYEESYGYLHTCAIHVMKNEDEAQYNIVYPIAAQILFGDCGPLESSTVKMLDSGVTEIMKKIKFHHDIRYDEYFPARRLCRAEITLNDGSKFVSKDTEPYGDSKDNVSIETIKRKFIKINSLYTDKTTVTSLADAILSTAYEEKFSGLLQKIQSLAKENQHPEIEFI